MNAVLIINILTSIVVFTVGILILAGVVIPANMSSTIRITFGIIFMAYGVYRFINFNTKRKLQKIEEEHERIEKEKDKLFDK